MELTPLLLIAGVFVLSIHGTYNGISFDGGQMIRMSFDEEHGLPATDFNTLRVGFRTRRKQGILMQVGDESHRQYISLELNNNGGVRFVVNKDRYPFELNTELTFTNYDGEVTFLNCADGAQHEVTVRRTNSGQHLIIEMKTEGSDHVVRSFGYLGQLGAGQLLDRPQYLYVGSNDTMFPFGFEGCITDMQIDNVYPIRQITHNSMPSYVDKFTAQKGC